MLKNPTKSGTKKAAKLRWRRRRLAPLKFSSTGYKFPVGGPVMYIKEDGGGGGQYCDGGFFGDGGGGDGGGFAGGGGDGSGGGGEL